MPAQRTCEGCSAELCHNLHAHTNCRFQDSIKLISDQISLGHLKEFQDWNFSFQGLFAGYGPESKVRTQHGDTHTHICLASCVSRLAWRACAWGPMVLYNDFVMSTAVHP